MKRIVLKRLAGFMLAIVAALAGWTADVEAALPYWTTSTDSSGAIIPAPHGYVPDKLIEGFQSPEHLVVTSSDEIYVADTGNDRIVHLDRQGKWIRTIPDPEKLREPNSKSRLRRPEGLFITETGDMYVADTGSRRIVVFNESGEFVKEFVRPNSTYLPASYLFVPSKIVLDKRGYMYIANKGGYQGLLQLTPEGDFSGFFGSNKVPYSWLDRMKRKFYTDEQLNEEQKKLPGAITNMTVDHRGFIYTVNLDLKKGQLKRLSSGGNDLLHDMNFAPWLGPTSRFSFQSVAVDRSGIMTVIESAGGRIYQFDQSGQRLFRFGSDFTVSPRFGLFKRPTGVGVNGKGDIYVTDGDLGVIQSFKRTEFGELVHQAVRLDEEGKYEEALDKWNRILVLDGMFDRAYRGIAKAEYKAGQYREAMEHFELAFDKEGYSESFWQIRMEWLMRYFGPIVTILCAVWISLSVTLMRRRKNRRGGESGERGAAAALSWKRSWTASCKMAVHVLRHPVNGMYDAAQSPDMRVWFAALLVAAAFAVHIAGLAFTRFIFADYRFAEVSIASEAMKFFLPLLGWMLANYLVGSVMKGEGSLRAVFIVNAYALMPFLAFNLPVRVITNVLTLQEKALYDAALAGIYIWVTLLLFIGSQMVHNYNLKEVIGMNFVSLFTLCCIGLFGFALVGLLYQAADFFIQLGRELFQRA